MTTIQYTLFSTPSLAIAQRLKTLLEDQLGVEVLLTREDNDTLPTLRERTQFANTHQGKLFISIHCNSNNSKTVHGYSAYVLGTAKSDDALAIAEKENSVVRMYESEEALNEYEDSIHILDAINQSSNLKESLDLAEITLGHLKDKTRLSQFGNGVYQAGFFVLVGAAMPRMLVEAAFISNEYEERQLRTRQFQYQVADALFESVKEFKELYEQGIR